MADGILTPCNVAQLISSGDCILQCVMWLWNRDSEFTKWQHLAIEFAQTSARDGELRCVKPQSRYCELRLY